MHAVSAIELTIDEAAVLNGRKTSSASGIDFEVEAAKQISPELSRAADSIEDDALRRQFLVAAGKCLVRRERSNK